MLTENDGGWIIKHPETGMVSQGRSRAEVLENLDRALAKYHRDVEELTDEEVRAAGIDSENIPDELMADVFQ